MRIDVLRDEEQQLTLMVYNQNQYLEVIISLAYAKFTKEEILHIWDLCMFYNDYRIP